MDVFWQLQDPDAQFLSSRLGDPARSQTRQKIEEIEAELKQLRARTEILEGLLALEMGITTQKMAEIVAGHVARVTAAKTVNDLALETVACPRCGRPVHRSLHACQVCGAPRPAQAEP
jgi:hypothetical protein